MGQRYRIFAVILILAVLAGVSAACTSASGLYIGKDGTYYRNEDGKNHVGFLRTDEGARYFGEDGRMVEEGIVEIDGSIYGFKKGFMVTGWLETELGTYYFDGSGKAVRGKQLIDGRVYLFDDETCVLLGEISEPDDETPTDQSPEPSAEPSAEPTTEPSEPSTEPTVKPSPSTEPTPG